MGITSRRQQSPAGPLNSIHPTFDRLLFVLALVGVLVTVHLIIQTGRGFDRGCLGFSSPSAAGATFDCNAVVQSDAGKLFGVSNGVWGLLYYLLLSAIGAGILLADGARVGTFKKVRAGLLVIGLIYSLYLINYQYSQVGEFCALCLTSAAVVALMFATQVAEYFKHRKDTPMTTNVRKPAGELRLVSSLAVLVLVLVGADFFYFSRLAVAAPQEQPIVEVDGSARGDAGGPVECVFNPERPAISNFREMVALGDPMKGNATAPVMVVEVFEPNCGHCKTAHPVVKEAAAKYGEKAAFYFKPVIFWPQVSTAQVHALYAANQEGRFFEMLDRQFAAQNPQTGLSLDQLTQMADAIGMNGAAMADRIESGMYTMMARQQTFQLTNTYGINSTPAILINGRTVAPQSRTVECIGQLIDQVSPQQ